MTGVFFGKCKESATLKTSKKGHAFVQIPLLVANGHDQCGYPNHETVRLVAFAELASRLSKTLRKGDEVRAEGAIRFERWNDREGFQRTGLALVASKVEKIGEAAKPPCKGRNSAFGGKKPPAAKKNISERMLIAAGRSERTPKRENENDHTREKPRIMGRDDFSYSYHGPEQCSNIPPC
jgi:single-stranded DNA-binding protein